MSSSACCYLDYNASTPIHPQVFETFLKVSKDCFGNPASSHALGQKAQAWIQKSREIIADVLECKPSEVWFTSGGTESNNWFLKMLPYPESRNHVVVSAMEHKSILKTAQFLESRGQISLSVLPVNSSGQVTLEEFRRSVRSNTVLLSLMLANIETGILQPIEELNSFCKSRSILLHTDVVAAIGKIPLSFNKLGVTALSISGHKLYAPKGVGVLVLKEGTLLDPLIHGCGQQCGYRSGTENVAAVAALGKAFELLQKGEFHAEETHRLTQKLQQELSTGLPFRPVFHGAGARLPNTLSVAFPGYSGHHLLQSLSARGIYVSAGAAANTGEPSHVLKAMGIALPLTQSTLRISLGWGNTANDIKFFMDTLSEILVKKEAHIA